MTLLVLSLNFDITHSLGASENLLNVKCVLHVFVTDETPCNCERFIRGGGMELFLQCLTVSKKPSEQGGDKSVVVFQGCRITTVIPEF